MFPYIWNWTVFHDAPHRHSISKRILYIRVMVPPVWYRKSFVCQFKRNRLLTTISHRRGVIARRHVLMFAPENWSHMIREKINPHVRDLTGCDRSAKDWRSVCVRWPIWTHWIRRTSHIHNRVSAGSVYTTVRCVCTITSAGSRITRGGTVGNVLGNDTLGTTVTGTGCGTTCGIKPRNTGTLVSL